MNETEKFEGGLGPEFERFLLAIDERNRLEYERGFKALMLAPTRAIYLALLRGEDVSVDQLRQEWVKRYGLKRT
jgi:hypothetical protein